MKWFVAVLIATLFCLTNLPWTLDDYDQAKQAFTSFEMVKEGHWLYQHTPTEKIATKPPLVGWISAGIYEVTRSWDLAWRLPSLLAAAALAFALTRNAGLVALSAFGLNLLSPRLATLVRTDMPLALVVFLIGLRIWQKLRSGEAWTTWDRFIIFLLLTAGMLIKGPIVYAFLLPGLLAFVWLEGRNAWPGWWPWIAALAVFLLWVAGGIKFVPGFYEQVVQREFLGRFGETVHRPQAFYFYVVHLLHKFAPWSILLVALAIVQRRVRPAPEVIWLICWSVGGLLLMSVIPSKRVDRIFPIVPPLCMLVAAQAGRLTSNRSKWLLATTVVACFFTSGYAAQRVLRSYHADDAALVKFGARIRREVPRFEVIGGREEGLLLYLRKTRFIKPEEAIARWNAGELDALVAPEEDVPRLIAEMRGASKSNRRASIRVNDEQRAYALIVRAPS